MKRWWYTSRELRTRSTSHAGRRFLVRAAVAGALSLPVARPSGDQVRLPRTGGAVIEAWAFGTLSDAMRPDSQVCDLDHVCELAISSAGGAGTGTGTTIQTSFESSSQGQPPPNLPFTLTETIDYKHPVTPGVRGGVACYPASGVMSIAIDAASTLVLDIVGQACQLGSNTARLVFTGSYVSDAASTGRVADADGIGSININNPSGLPSTSTNNTDPTWLKASLVGQLKYGQ